MLNVTLEVPVTIRGQAICDFCKQAEHLDQTISVSLEEIKDGVTLSHVLPDGWDRVYKRWWNTDDYGSGGVNSRDRCTKCITKHAGISEGWDPNWKKVAASH